MSRDCEYIFSWVTLPYLGGDPAPQLQTKLHSQYSGRSILIDPFTLYWECDKHGINLKKELFSNLPDQVFERADGAEWIAMDIA